MRLLYIVGLRRLWHRAGTDRGVRRWEAGAFAAGWLSLFVALVSPLDIFLLLGLALFAAWLGEGERRVALTEAGGGYEG